MNAISTIISAGMMTKRKIYGLLGKVSSDLAATMSLVYEWTKKLSSWDTSQSIPDYVLRPLKMLAENLGSWKVASHCDGNIKIFHNASGSGCGAEVQNGNGKVIHSWSQAHVDKSLDSAIIELCRLKMFLDKNRAFLEGLPAVNWHFFSNNFALIHYLNLQKDPEEKIKANLVEKILDFFHQNGRTPVFHHISRVQNSAADKLSHEEAPSISFGPGGKASASLAIL